MSFFSNIWITGVSKPLTTIGADGGDSLCNIYVFSDTNPDFLELGSPFTGNLKVYIASDSETGIHPDIIAGRQGVFAPSTDLLGDPQWVRYEISAVAIDHIVDATFNGRVAYAKDNVWSYLDMGWKLYAIQSSSYTQATLTTPIIISADNIMSLSVIGLDNSTSLKYFFKVSSTGSYVYYRGSDGRFRIKMDDGRIYTFNVPELADGAQHSIQIEFSFNTCHLYIDNAFYATTLGISNSFTLDAIGADATVFAVTMANVASFPMVTPDTFGVNAGDTIGSNSLTYDGLVLPTVPEDYTEVQDD